MRASNTSVPDTCETRGDPRSDRLNVGIHWIDATLNVSDPLKVLILAGIDPCEGVSESRPGRWSQDWYQYWHRLTTRYGHVLYDARGERPARLVMSGEACERFLAEQGAQRVLDLLTGLHEYARHIHRVDFYIDDCTGRLTLKKIQRHLAERAFRSPFRDFTDRGNPTAPLAPRTIYLGSPKSDLRVRIYDKRAKAANDTRNRETPDQLTPWLRFELEARKSKARAFAKQTVSTSVEK